MRQTDRHKTMNGWSSYRKWDKCYDLILNPCAFVNSKKYHVAYVACASVKRVDLEWSSGVVHVAGALT